jgi:hypothetical protein
MAKTKKRTNGAMDALRVEMAQPHIASSALEAMGSKTKRPKRKLEFIGYFYGYQCSHCKCRFPESALPNGASITLQNGNAEANLQSTFVNRLSRLFATELKTLVTPPARRN